MIFEEARLERTIHMYAEMQDQNTFEDPVSSCKGNMELVCKVSPDSNRCNSRMVEWY